MLDLSDFIGVWRTQEFPGCVDNSQGTITMHVSSSGKATLWKLQGSASTTFSEGQLEIVDNQDGSFEINIDGNAIDDIFLTISGNLYIPNPSPSFISKIPNHGKKYFEKL